MKRRISKKWYKELLRRAEELYSTPDFALRLEVNNFYTWLKSSNTGQERK